VVNSSNVLISDFNFDNFPLPYTAARVIAVSLHAPGNGQSNKRQKNVNSTLHSGGDGSQTRNTDVVTPARGSTRGSTSNDVVALERAFPKTVTVELEPGHPLFESVPAFSTCVYHMPLAEYRVDSLIMFHEAMFAFAVAF
jgi:hypothetical protein